jgi:long-chain fatty acid transport protein
MNIFIRTAFLVAAGLIMPTLAAASGYGVFTQGASGLGQANAVVAHTTGPSSVYFNPALLNRVDGRQVEVGTTAIYADRKIKLDSGNSEDGDSKWNFPSTFYYSHEVNDKFTTGFGVFFPFGLSNDWNDDYEGRYLGTEGDILTMNLNPVVAYQVTEKLSLAAGFSMLYMDATLKNRINQTAAYDILSKGAPLPPREGELPDIRQKFDGDGWGAGYNLGAYYRATDRLSFGATYRSHIDVDIEGNVDLDRVDPMLALAFPEGNGEADIRLPAQATFAIAYQLTTPLIVEAGVRWEDWDSTNELKLDFDNPILGQSSNSIPRDWSATWTYNIGGQYRFNETIALNAGYLYGNNAVPGDTFEPLIPDSDAHLFTIGTDLSFGQWTFSTAFGYEHHEDRDKNNTLGDPLGPLVGQPDSTANGTYETDIYLFALSLGYAF